MVLVGLFVIHGLGLIREKSDRPSALTYLPPGLFTMAVLLALLQPEFNLAEVCVHAGDLVWGRRSYWCYRNLSNTTYEKSILKNARFSGKGRQSLHI